MNKIILASASPRRRELLRQAGLSFEVCPSSFEEKVTGGGPAQVAEALSRQKASDVYEKLKSRRGAGRFTVIGADTVVALDGDILGKPRDREEACRMLERLQGRTHRVYTGVTLLEGDKSRTFHGCTEVTFYPLGREEISDYVETGEPMDKAGAYGIQGLGALLVEKISGDYNNVVGLPLARLCRELRDL